MAAEAGNFARAATAARVWFVLRRVEAGVHLVNIAVTTHDLVKQFEAVRNAVKAGKMTQAQADAAYGHLALMATGLGLLSIVQFHGAVKTSPAGDRRSCPIPRCPDASSRPWRCCRLRSAHFGRRRT